MKRQLVVVGGGLIGASVALAAATNTVISSEFEITLIDAQTTPEFPKSVSSDQYDPRVVALTQQSVELLKALGVWSTICSVRVCEYDRMYVWDNEGTSHIEFKSEATPYAQLGYIVENSLVCAALYQSLRDVGVEVLKDKLINVVQQKDSLSLTLENKGILTPEYVVACDGANSMIRDSLGVRLEQSAYGQKAIVSTLRSQLSHQHTAWQNFLSTGPLALLPLADDHRISIVWSADDERAEELMALDDLTFNAEITKASEGVLGELELIDRRFSFPLRRTHAREYVGRGWSLVGDAAHVIHPLAGQGANLGLSDVLVLIEEIERQLERGVSLAAPLSRYARRRRMDNSMTGLGMSFFKNIYGSSRPFARVLRNEGMKIANNNSFLKDLLLKQSQGR